jgi:YfiH family protein
VHAGWQGTVKKVVKSAIQVMHETYRSNPRDMIAAIGPSIAQHHYPVGPEVVDQVSQSFGSDAVKLIDDRDGKCHFDMWTANSLLLQSSGINQIENPEICTVCNLQDWFSHRGEQGKTGRFGVLITVGK